MTSEILRLAVEHLLLVGVSTSIAVVIGVPLGIVASRRASLGRAVLAATGVVQVIPSLALFGLLLPVPIVGGVGAGTAIVALVLYALLPVVRGTVTGIRGIDPAVREAAEAMGMTSMQRLAQVELPLALGVIVAGVRVATVIGVGVATIAAAIGAGGLGTPIFRGLRMNDDRLVLAGAIPAALLALGLDQLLGAIGRRMERVPYGVERVPVTGRRRALRPAIAALVAASLVAAALRWRSGSRAAGTATVTICTKDFSEQVILGELLAQELEDRGVSVVRRFELGGSLCHEALLSGQVDVYPEYTGTSWTALLHHAPLADAREVLARLRVEYQSRHDVVVGDPIGFRDDFAILVREGDGERLGLRTLGDLSRVAPGLRAGFGQDFMSRPDGYASLVAAYGLRFREAPREMDLSLTYRALAEGEVDVIAGNTTDARIESLRLRPLRDDRGCFPPYEAVWLARRDALERAPVLAEALREMEGSLSTEAMRRLNREVDARKRSPAEVARRWRRDPASRAAGP